ncbi:MAG: nitroreductase family protein [Acidimicrobiales bacterium]
MDVYEALYTTRAMRRVKPDPVPDEVQQKILDAAIRAPTGGNTQGWRFLLVDDPGVIGEIAPIYRECIDFLWTNIYNDRIAEAEADPESESSKAMSVMRRSVEYAVDHFAEYPLLLFAFDQADTTGGSIFPAVWSAMLAARAEGVGSSLTSVLMIKGEQVPELLGVPGDEGWRMVCCVPMGYPKGKWGVPARQPAHAVSFRNHWGEPVGFENDEPLWP